MLIEMLLFFSRGARSIHAPVPQYTPTFAEVNELTTSGALPERIAAVILSSLIDPTTLTVTSGCAESYSATTFLNSPSSRALQPTQTVSLTGPLFELGAKLRALAAIAAANAAASSAATNTARLIGKPPRMDR